MVKCLFVVVCHEGVANYNEEPRIDFILRQLPIPRSTHDGARYKHDRLCHCFRLVRAYRTRKQADAAAEALGKVNPSDLYWSIKVLIENDPSYHQLRKKKSIHIVVYHEGVGAYDLLKYGQTVPTHTHDSTQHNHDKRCSCLRLVKAYRTTEQADAAAEALGKQDFRSLYWGIEIFLG